MTCQACIERGKTWNGSDPACAFETGEFNRDNWRCATLSLIRRVTEVEDNRAINYVHCDNEENYATVDVSDIDETGDALTLWVQWYKNRGRTQAMWLLSEVEPPRRPTEAECVAIAKYYEKQVNKGD